MKRRPEEARVIRGDRNGDAGTQQKTDAAGHLANRREGARGDIGRRADVENDAAFREPPH